MANQKLTLIFNSKKIKQFNRIALRTSLSTKTQLIYFFFVVFFDLFLEEYTSVGSQYKGVNYVLTSTRFNGTYGSYYKTEVTGSGTSSVLVPFGTDTNFALSPIVPVQAMYCDLYYVLARAICQH